MKFSTLQIMSAMSPPKHLPGFFLAALICLFPVGPGCIAQDAPPTDATGAAKATVGDPQNPDGLQQALNDAYKAGTHQITITPGTYLFPREKKIHLELNAWMDCTINGVGVNLILDNPDASDVLFNLTACSNVTVEGMYTSQTTITAFQGHVVAIGKEANGDWACDWTPSPGYPIPPDDEPRFWANVVDAQTHELKTGENEFTNDNAKTDNGHFRLRLGNRQPDFQVGDLIVARYGNPPAKFHLDDSFDCTIRNVVMTHNGFAPIFESSGGGNHIINVKWTLGPRPPGATEDPVVTNSADGIHCANSNPGPDIEGCTFEGIFLDDCIAIHGAYQKVTNVNGSSLTVENGYAKFRQADPARISNDKGFYLQARVNEVKDNGNGTQTLILDSKVEIPPGCAASNPRYDGQGYRLIGNKLGHTRSRGIIAKADNGLIKGNIIEHANLPIRLGCEWPSEADYSNNVVVEDNTFNENGAGAGGYVTPAITLDGSGVKQNYNILIRNNHFNSDYSGEVGIFCADTVVVQGNFFIPPTAWPKNKSRAAIYVRTAQNVTLGGNQIDPNNTYSQPFIDVGDDVTNLIKDTP